MAKKITQKTKTEMPCRDAGERSRSFDEVALGYTIDMAVAEANRCIECKNEPCIAGCPAGALAGANLALACCVAWRRQADSPCAFTCLARLACPVGAEHRYDEAQLRHSYGISLAMLDRR